MESFAAWHSAVTQWPSMGHFFSKTWQCGKCKGWRCPTQYRKKMTIRESKGQCVERTGPGWGRVCLCCVMGAMWEDEGDLVYAGDLVVVGRAFSHSLPTDSEKQCHILAEHSFELTSKLAEPASKLLLHQSMFKSKKPQGSAITAQQGIEPLPVWNMP